MKTISNEIRELLVDAKKRGEKEGDIAIWLKISVRSVRRIWRLYKETESVQPKTRLGRKSSIDAAAIAKIQDAVKLQPDITLEELIDELDLPIKKSRLSVILIGLGLTFKKRRCSQRNS